MLSKRNIFQSTFCSILFIVITSSASIDTEKLMLDLPSYPDAYSEDDYFDSVNIYDYMDRKMKRQTSTALRYNQEDFLPIPNLSFSKQKMQELLRILKKPKKSGDFTLNGWSASGMPFNVLYTPNTLQQKFLTAVNTVAMKKPTVQIPTPQPLRRENLVSERKEDKELIRISGMKTSIRSPQVRRHYLVIPQLFVSYGWDSIGK